LETIIQNGLIIDGTGKKGYQADIIIKNGRIEAITDCSREIGTGKTIDASGFVVAPGFIDVHSHSELWFLQDPYAEAKISQGITTEITGNCGLTPAPLWGQGGEEFKKYASYILGNIDQEWGWENVESLLKLISQSSPAVNIAYLFGHNNLRASVIGGFKTRKSSRAEINLMKAKAEKAMQDGAIGFSTGLGYYPGMWADKDEIIEILKAIKKYDGIYVTHIRNSGRFLLSSLEEAIDVADRAGTPLHISHMKTIGKFNWGKIKAVKQLLDQASDHLEITTDAYPFTSGSGYLQTLLPDHLFSDGMKAFFKKLQDDKVKEKIKDQIGYEVNFEEILIIGIRNERDNKYTNKTLGEIAQMKNMSVMDAMIELIIEEEGNVMMIMEGMCEEDIGEILSWPSCMLGTDGLPQTGNMCHPRTYSSFSRFLSNYVREKGLLSLEEGIRRITKLPAETFGLAQRGALKEGYYGDIVIFDYNNLADISSPESPFPGTKGIKYLLINGEIVLKNGVKTGSRPGMIV